MPSLLLAALLLVPLVSCSNNVSDSSETKKASDTETAASASSDESVETEAETDPLAELYADLPTGNYDGYDFVMLNNESNFAYTFMTAHYPANYGFIPLTYADDDDPLDVLVLCSEEIIPMTIVDSYPIGVIKMIDNGKPDEKIIAICKTDPYYNCYDSIYELPSHIFDEMKHFFSVYKALENKTTAVDELGGKEEAKRIIEKSLKNYKEKRQELLNI